MSTGAENKVVLNPGAGGRSMRVRTIDGLSDSPVDQEVVTLADGSGNLLNPASEATLAAVLATLPPNSQDYGNSTTGLLGANQVFTGTWVEVDNYGNIITSAVVSSPLSSLAVQWSDDGSTVKLSSALTAHTIGTLYGYLSVSTPVGKFYRIVVTNGATPQTFQIISTYLQREVYSGSYTSLGDSFNDLTAALLTRSVIAGIDPAGTYHNVGLPGRDPKNSSTALLTANTSVSLANGTITSGSTAITTATSFFTPSMTGLGVSDSLGFIPAGTTLTYVSATSATLSQNATGSSTVDQFTSALTPPAGATFTGSWVSTASFQALLAFAYADANWSYLAVEWSDDGINPTPSALGVQSLLPAQSFPVGPTTYYIALDTMTTMVRPYYRFKAVNGPVAQTLGEIDVWLYTTGFSGSYGALNAQLSTLSTALLTRSVTAGVTPNGTFTNLPAPGNDVTNSTSTPLNANQTYRGTWYPWQGNYIKAVVDMASDVSGTLYFDFSEAVTPVNGDESSVTASLIYAYNPVVEPLLRREFPVQSKWYRTRYVNGVAAQSVLSIDVALLTTDPGLASQLLAREPTTSNIAGIVRSVPATLTAPGASTYQDVPVDSGGVPTAHIVAFDPSIYLAALNTWQVKQIPVGTTATQLDATPLANRRTISIVNQSGTVSVYVGQNSSVTSTSGELISPLGSTAMQLGPSGQVWAICPPGGVQTVYQRAGGSASGTATTPSGAVGTSGSPTGTPGSGASAANGQTIAVSGYTSGTSNTIVKVRLGLTGHKNPSPTTETVGYVGVTTGTALNVGSVATSTSVPITTTDTYICSVSWRNVSATITAITGMGLTWTQVGTTVTNGNTAEAVFTAPGTGGSTGVVTASFSTTITSGVITVSEYTNVDQTSPVTASTTLTANSSTIAGSVNGVAGGRTIICLNGQNRTISSPGAGFTIRSDVTASSAGNASEGGLVGGAITVTGSQSFSVTLSGNATYSATALTLNPGLTIQPVVNLAYTTTAGPGATSGNITLPSTTDSTQYVDISADQGWTNTLVSQITFTSTTTTGAASALIDFQFVEITDSTGNTTVCSVKEMAP